MTPSFLRYAFPLLGLLLPAGLRAAPAPLDPSLTNEAGELRFTLALDTGRPTYRIDLLQRGGPDVAVIAPSPLGLTRTDADFTSDLTLVSVSAPVIVDETYPMVAGKRSLIHARARERTFVLQNALHRTLTLTVRAAADGIAFRYGFPGRSCQLRQLVAESTGFKLPAGRVWLQPYDRVDTWAPGYESRYRNGIPVGTAAPGPAGWAFPALFETDGRWVLVTEAGLDANNFAAHLQPDAPDGLYRIRLPEADETYDVAPQADAITLPWVSAWRTIIIGDRLATIVESDLVDDLAAPSTEPDTSWIKPGRVAWSWWSDRASPSDFKKQQAFVDLARDLHWEYCLVDAGWEKMTDGGDVAALAAYARSQGVGLILWYNSGGRHNRTFDATPRDLMDDPLVRDAEMARIAALGIKGIKVDFMQSDKQYIVALYQDIARDAARHHLLVDFHGATLPRGWSRTYPNLLTMEAVSGSEQYWDAKFAEEAQTLNSIYPFTRNVVGSMDYTPMILADPPHQQPHLTTNAHELALAVVFESGLQHFVASAESIRAQPDYVRDFLRDVPVAWDETRFVAGFPGQLAVLARRRGADWYLAGVNGEKAGRHLEVPLGFLGSGDYTLDLIADGDSPHTLAHSVRSVRRETLVSLELAARGGFTARLRPRS